jgi:uncharacterized repeat protein (TIGR01451 family)
MFKITGKVISPEKTTPDVSSDYALNDEIPFTIKVNNVSNDIVHDVKVTDENAVLVPGDGYTISGNTATIASIASGASVAIGALHVVTEEDIIKGTVGNTATVTFGDDTIDVEASTDRIEDKYSHLKVEKDTTSKPANGTAYALGETIKYSITVTNDGNVTLTDVSVEDTLEGFAFDENAVTSGITLAPGQSHEVHGSYVVTEEDVLSGKVVNEATASGSDPTGDEPGVDPGTKEDPAGPKNSHLKVEKTTTSTPANGTAYALGETIRYSITVPLIS